MAYLLTVSRTDYSARKRRWSEPGYRSKVRTIGSPELRITYPGLLLLVDDNGHIAEAVPLLNPKGMLRTEDGVLVACFAEIRHLSSDLTSSARFLSEPWSNDLHSLRPSGPNMLVAVAGVDAAFEVSPSGTTTWAWWAAEHGYSKTSDGEPWTLGTDKDHRKLSYPAGRQSTHINCMAALDEETYLATLPMPDQLIAVNRATGARTVLLDGLGHPHAVRVLGDGLVTLADTTAGQGLLVRVGPSRAEVLERVEIDTTWLHDVHYDDDGWLLVDGANARVLRCDRRGRVLQVDTFDPEWCLYEALAWPAP
jgi:hypothetical protein